MRALPPPPRRLPPLRFFFGMVFLRRLVGAGPRPRLRARFLPFLPRRFAASARRILRNAARCFLLPHLRLAIGSSPRFGTAASTRRAPSARLPATAAAAAIAAAARQAEQGGPAESVCVAGHS